GQHQGPGADHQQAGGGQVAAVHRPFAQPRDPVGGDELAQGLHPVREHLQRHPQPRSEEHTSELQSRFDLVCRLLLEKKNIIPTDIIDVWDPLAGIMISVVFVTLFLGSDLPSMWRGWDVGGTRVACGWAVGWGQSVVW